MESASWGFAWCDDDGLSEMFQPLYQALDRSLRVQVVEVVRTKFQVWSTVLQDAVRNDQHLAQLTETFYRDHQPATALERALLDNIIRDTWLLARFARIDAEILDHQIHDTHYPCKDHPAGKAFLDTSAAQLRLQRRINDTRKSQLQALKEFQRLQAERRAQPSLTQPEPLDVTAVPSTPKEQIGFVSQPMPDAPAVQPIVLPPAAKTGPGASGVLADR